MFDSLYAFLEHLIISSVFIFILLVLRHFIRNRIKASALMIIWGLVLLKLFVPITIESPLSVEKIVKIEEKKEIDDFADYDIYNDNTNIYNISEDSIISNNRNSDNLIFLFWLLGFALVLILPIVSSVYFIYERKKYVCERSELLDLEIKVAYSANKTQIPKIYFTNCVTTPCLIGPIKPKIYLPYELKGSNENELFYMILHEVMHAKKQHVRILWIYFIVRSIYWFNPLIWIIKPLLKQDLEHWCDQDVLNCIPKNEHKDYGYLLIEQASSKVECTYAMRSVAFSSPKKVLKDRIKAIAANGKKHRIALIIFVLIMLVLSVTFLTRRSENDFEDIIATNIMNKILESNDKVIKVSFISYTYNGYSDELQVVFDWEFNEDYEFLQNYTESDNSLVEDNFNFNLYIDDVRVSNNNGDTQSKLNKDGHLQVAFDLDHTLINEDSKIKIALTSVFFEIKDIETSYTKEIIGKRISLNSFLDFELEKVELDDENPNKINYSYKLYPLKPIRPSIDLKFDFENNSLKEGESTVGHREDAIYANGVYSYRDPIKEDSNYLIVIKNVEIDVNRSGDYFPSFEIKIKKDNSNED